MAALGIVAQSAIRSTPDFSQAYDRVVIKRTSIRKRRKPTLYKARRLNELQQINASGRKSNLLERLRRRLYGEDTTRAKLINGMTNWQNHQWMKNGAHKTITTISHFASLVRG